MKLHVTPSNFFSRIVRSEAYSFFFFFRTAVLRKLFDIQTLQFLTWLPTRQDGFQNRDKV